MCKISDVIIICLILIGSCAGYSGYRNNTLHDDKQLKITLVEEIIRKVCNLSLAVFSNKAPEEKAKMLIKIEEKLNKSAHSLGQYGNKYVQLIMKGVKSKAFDKQDVVFTKDVMKSKNAKILRDVDNIEEPTSDANATKTPKSKNKLVTDIARKIELLAEKYLKGAKTKEERQKAIENIKQKFIESADRKHAMLHSKHQEIKNYVDLVAKGIELVMHKNADSKNSKRRRMEFVFTDNINVNKDRVRNSDEFEPIKGNSLHNNELGQDTNVSPKLNSAIIKSNKLNDIKAESSCNEALQETCQKVQLVNMFTCQTSGRKINILKLCDGVGDCLDFSDERQCADRAIETIQSANHLMKHIDTHLSQNCYSDVLHKSVMLKQNQILSNVLQNQLTFLHKHALKGASQYSRRVLNSDEQSVKQTAHEAVAVVNTLSSALQKSLCSSSPDNAQKNKNHLLDGMGMQELEMSTLPLEMCKCNGQSCISKYCSTRCSEMCYEKYTLSQWSCDAVTGEKYVLIDMICDGKLDCYDETDEHGCSKDIGLVKFEATKMYEYILDLIKTKASSIQFETIRNKLLNLHALIIELRKLTIKRYSDTIEVKRVRDRSFAELTVIYEVAARLLEFTDEAADLYIFLSTINERLVSALKRSNTGNDQIISPDGCICRDYRCALPRCSKSCTRACSAEPKLTRYFCSGSELNNSIPIELICNGKNNCPEGDDETDCRKEVCRGHHLVLLRHNIRDVGLVHQGTAMGEALRSWGVKVKATLMVSENNDRPTPAVLRDIVHDILHDLVMAYATVEDSRRTDTSIVFQEFYTWSRIVIDILKSCGQ